MGSERSYSVEEIPLKFDDARLKIRRGRKVLGIGERVGIDMRWISTPKTEVLTGDLRNFVDVTQNARCMVWQYKFRLGYAYLALRDAYGVEVAERCSRGVMHWIWGRPLKDPISVVDLFTAMMEANALRTP